MHCIRCQGLMAFEILVDQAACGKLSVWRCIACGELIDHLILMNRAYPKKKERCKRVQVPV